MTTTIATPVISSTPTTVTTAPVTAAELDILSVGSEYRARRVVLTARMNRTKTSSSGIYMHIHTLPDKYMYVPQFTQSR